MFRVLCILVFLLPKTVFACDLALLLAVDVSGSVDRQEYNMQMQGLAEALRDPNISEALARQSAKVALLQWTGATRQHLSIGWTDITTSQDSAALADNVAGAPRVWRNYSTAVGEALATALAAFDHVPECHRRVIDVSGDGPSNEGLSPHQVHIWLKQRQITVNAIAIETDAFDLTAYFFENVIHGPGAFVMTANGFEDYARKIRLKLARETLDPLSALTND